MERSLYVDFDLYKDCDTLMEVFSIIGNREKQKNDLGKIIPQGTKSNIPSQVWMFVNLKESVKRELEKFSNNFGLQIIGDTFFWSHPGCACNNPVMIRYTSKVLQMPDYVKSCLETGHPYSSFLNIRMAHCDYWDNDTLYQDDEYYYAPYKMCNGALYKLPGCSDPSDIGYILHNKSIG